MQCKQLELALEQEDLLSDNARAHLAECGSCRGLAADLDVISRAARQFPAEVEPPAHIWTSLRAQLEEEGIIKTPSREQVPAGAAADRWWSGLFMLFGTRGLAAAALGVVIVAGVLLERQSIFGSHDLRSRLAGNLYTETSAVLRNDEATLPNIKRAADTSIADHSLQKNLEIVNDFIADCERRVKQEPRDDFAGDYLSHAYQQKAELLSAMMEPGE